jgi:hypothetical protein
MPRASIDITGQRFGRLVAIRMTAKSSVGPPQRGEMWLLRCDDGNEIEAIKANVLSGRTRSCGCLQAETCGKGHTIHGHAGAGVSSEYNSWRAMHQRCSNPNHKSYKNWGGRGITVCERWESFENFLSDMGLKPSPEHTLHRVDGDDNYKPGNVRWALPVEQANNTSRNRLITMAGETHTEAEWCRDLGVSKQVLLNRIGRWSPEILAMWVRIRREKLVEETAA